MLGKKKFRRHSAPEAPTNFTPRQPVKRYFPTENWSRASVSDFSILLENQSESCSSLELDTSNLSMDLTPVPTPKSSLMGSYKNLPCSEGRQHFEDCSTRNHVLGSWYLWRLMILSQTAAGCLGIMLVSYGKIKEGQHLTANGQNLLNYVLLGVTWTTQLALRNKGRDFIEIIRYSGLRYLCLSVLHVEINYLTLSSLHHGTFLGNQVIDCMAASLSFIIAYVLLEVQYHVVHVFGFALAVGCGLGILYGVDPDHGNQQGDDILLGDVLRMVCGVCLGYSSVAQEIIVKATGYAEYLGMVGLIGSFVCGIQVMCLEANKVLPMNPSHWSNILIYSLAQFSFQSLTPKILREGSATGLHLTLISAEFYSHLIGFLLKDHQFCVYYLVSHLAVIAGSCLFAAKKAPIGAQYCYPIKIVVMKSG